MAKLRHVALAFATVAAVFGAGCAHSPLQLGAGHKPAVFKARSAKEAELAKGLQGFQAQLKTFSAVATFWETDGKDTQTNTAEIFLAQPGKIRANVLESSNSMKRGAKMVYLGDKTVRVKLGFIKKTFAYDDPMVVSTRGYRIDQTDLTAVIGGVIHPQATLTYKGAATLNGKPVEMLEVVSPAILPGTEREVIALDPQTFAPVQLEAFSQGKVVFKLGLTKGQINPTLPDDTFTL